MSKLSIAKPGRVDTISPLRILIMVLAILVVLFIYLAPGPIPRERSVKILCMAHLKSMAVSFIVYSDDFEGNLPGVESWCDALRKYMLPENLICPGSNVKEGQSTYAMNELLDGKKLAELPPDLVLLFESKPGWNKTGGPEILTMEDHEVKAAMFCLWMDM